MSKLSRGRVVTGRDADTEVDVVHWDDGTFTIAEVRRETRDEQIVDQLVSEAIDGPWWPDRGYEQEWAMPIVSLWLTNHAGDSLHIDAEDIAALLNVRLGTHRPRGADQP